MPKIPLAEWISEFVNWLYAVLGPLFNFISDVVRAVIGGIDTMLGTVPWWLLILVFAGLAWYRSGWRLALGTAVGLVLIYDLRLWEDMVNTLVLVLVASVLSIVIGLPLGIWSARRAGVYRVLSPLLDLMQTMPAFVYLVPVLIFFNIGVVPALFATVVFAMPPAIRLTRLGILQVPAQLVEAARAFGASDTQLLRKVQIPIAMPSIKAGINQTIMLSLSMVVIAAMIGAGGLGADVMSALETIDVGRGFEAGISIVILAIVLDRLTQQSRGVREKQ